MTAGTQIRGLLAFPEEPVQHRIATVSTQYDVQFLAWTSVTFLAASGKFDNHNGYALDIDRLYRHDQDPHTPIPRLEINDNESDALRLGAYSYVGTGARGRLRTFGSDIEAAGYICALPHSQVRSDVRMYYRRLRADWDDSEDIGTLDFGEVSSVLAWTGVSLIEPMGRFDRNHGVAIDITHHDDLPVEVLGYGGVLLGDEGHPDNLFYGAWSGTAESIRVRLRVFGDQLAAGGYVCVLAYPLYG